jgi:hypothetical protein
MDEMPDVGNQKPCAREFAIMGLKGKYIYIYLYIYTPCQWNLSRTNGIFHEERVS